MIPTCHLYSATGTLLCSCPCASMDMARTIALCQRDTLNLVTSERLFAGYQIGQLIFICHTNDEFEEWKRKLLKPNENKRSRTLSAT